MRAVAAGAFHFALAYRMRVRLHGLRPLLLVAIEANLDLRRCCQDRVIVSVHRVASGTGNGIAVVPARVPGKALVAAMARDAVAVLIGNGRAAHARKRGYRWPLLSATHAPGMIATGTMTGFALQLPVAEGRIRVPRNRVRGLEYR